jgi:hypothetical protein
MKKRAIHKSNEFLGNERRFERFPVEVPARIELLHGRRKEQPFFSQTLDLSASGAFFPEFKRIRLGDMLKIDFYLVFENYDSDNGNHDMVTLTVTGKVIRSEASGTAIRFEEDYEMSARKLFPIKEANSSVVSQTENTDDFPKLFKKLPGKGKKGRPETSPEGGADAGMST